MSDGRQIRIGLGCAGLQAALLGVPFVDALTTERDPTLPLTVGEWEEWGVLFHLIHLLQSRCSVHALIPLDAADIVHTRLLSCMPQRDAKLISELVPHPGDPLHNRSAYEYMKSYSPYDNVKAQPYPHMLVTAGLSDPRVSYWEVRHVVAWQLPMCMSV
jgi:protease II